MNADQKRQKMIRLYKEKTGVTDVNMKDVAKYAVEKHGWKPPKPKDPLDLMAGKFARSAGLEMRKDVVTKDEYRANLAIPAGKRDGKNLHLWIDIDDPTATRFKMVKAIRNYREQMIGEGVTGVNTTNHWNRQHPDQLPIVFETDLTDEILWRKNGDQRKAS